MIKEEEDKWSPLWEKKMWWYCEQKMKAMEKNIKEHSNDKIRLIWRLEWK